MRIPHQYNPKKERLKKRIGFYSIVFLILGASCVGLYYWSAPKIKKSSFFTYKGIIFNSIQHIAENEIKQFIHIPTGINIFDLDLDLIKSDIEKHPWVLTASVSRMLPCNIRVILHEKTPVAILSHGELFYLDKEGKKIASIRSGENTQFPIISGVTEREFQSGKIIQEAFSLISQYQSQTFLKDYALSEVHWNEVQGFVLYTSEPTFEIRLGKEDFVKRFDRLKKVLNDLAQKTLSPRVIDLNFTKKVVVKVQK